MERIDRTVSSGAEPTLRDRQKEAVRQELHEAAVELFRQGGFAATSVDQIARRAGVSRSTFFRYFGSKEAIVAAETDEGGLIFIEALAARPADEGRMEALENALVELAETMRTDERRDEMIVLEQIIASDRSLTAAREAAGARWRHEVARALAVRAGRAEPDVEDVLAAAILSQITELVRARWQTGEGRPVRELIRSCFESFRRLAGREVRPG